jgi:hypothetical protein
LNDRGKDISDRLFKMGYLMNKYGASTNKYVQAALQLAIWNTLEDTDYDVTKVAGNTEGNHFEVTSGFNGYTNVAYKVTGYAEGATYSDGVKTWRVDASGNLWSSATRKYVNGVYKWVFSGTVGTYTTKSYANVILAELQASGGDMNVTYLKVVKAVTKNGTTTYSDWANRPDNAGQHMVAYNVPEASSVALLVMGALPLLLLRRRRVA